MLFKIANDNLKSAMGLLSTVPGLRSVNNLQTEINWYKEDTNRQLYGWKKENNGDIAGVVGIEIISEKLILVRHVVLSIRFKDVENIIAMLNDLQLTYVTYFIMGTLDTQKIINIWHNNDYSKI